MTQLATRIASAARATSSEFKVEGSDLLVSLPQKDLRIRVNKLRHEEMRWAKMDKYLVDSNNNSRIKSQEVNRKNKGKFVRKERLLFSPISLTFNCLPILVMILNSSGYSYRELGVENSPVFRSLIESETSNIDRILITGEKSKYRGFAKPVVHEVKHRSRISSNDD